MLGPERSQSVDEYIALVAQRIGVSLGLVGGRNFHGRLGHDRAQAGVLGRFVEESELFGRNRELSVGLFDALAHVEETPFDRSPGHDRQCTRRGL